MVGETAHSYFLHYTTLQPNTIDYVDEGNRCRDSAFVLPSDRGRDYYNRVKTAYFGSNEEHTEVADCWTVQTDHLSLFDVCRLAFRPDVLPVVGNATWYV